jgi:hypothetical protein
LLEIHGNNNLFSFNFENLNIFKNIIYLDLSNNKIIDDNLKNLMINNLEYFNLQNNLIKGQIFNNIASLNNLKYLNLNLNLLNNIFDLKSIESLNLNNNNITGEISSKFSNLKNLTYHIIILKVKLQKI